MVKRFSFNKNSKKVEKVIPKLKQVKVSPSSYSNRSIKFLLKKTKEFKLVEKGIKPVLFIQIPKKNKQYINLKIEKINSEIFYFAEEWNDKYLNLFVFNKKSLKKVVSKINLKNVNNVIKLIHFRYSFREEFKLLTKKEKLNYQLIEGICFGYPISCVKEFIKEMSLKKLRKDRIIYRVSKNVLFVGYPEFSEECVRLVSFWKKAIKK